MTKFNFVCAAIMLSCLASGSVLAQAQPSGGSGSMAGNSMGSSMGMSGPGQKMTDMDKMMVKNCKAMSPDKMKTDPECQDYMKNHPDWMKAK